MVKNQIVCSKNRHLLSSRILYAFLLETSKKRNSVKYSELYSFYGNSKKTVSSLGFRLEKLGVCRRETVRAGFATKSRLVFIDKQKIADTLAAIDTEIQRREEKKKGFLDSGNEEINPEAEKRLDEKHRAQEQQTPEYVQNLDSIIWGLGNTANKGAACQQTK